MIKSFLMKEAYFSGESYLLPKINLATLSGRSISIGNFTESTVDSLVQSFVMDLWQDKLERITPTDIVDLFRGVSIKKEMRYRMSDYGLNGNLFNFNVSQAVDNEMTGNLPFLRSMNHDGGVALVSSADYQSVSLANGRIFNMFMFNLVKKNNSSQRLIPKLKFSAYIQLPLSVAEELKGKQKSGWLSAKNSFENGL